MRFRNFFFAEGYHYDRNDHSDTTTEYDFVAGSNNYQVIFEKGGDYLEMIFGIKQPDGSIDTKVLTNQPGDVIKVLNTIFDDILLDFVEYNSAYENEFDIILSPQTLEGEDHNSDPFQRKRGRLYVKKIKDAINRLPGWKNYEVEFKPSNFEPKAIIMSIKKRNPGGQIQ